MTHCSHIHYFYSYNTQGKEIVRTVSVIPYQSVGSWRPDFLLPVDASLWSRPSGGIKICEINARYSFNAFFASYNKNHSLANLPYLSYCPIMPVTELEDIPDTFLSAFDCTKSVGILKASEEGWDVKLFQREFNRRANELGGEAQARFVLPSSLRLNERGELCDDIGELSQFALECKQTELLAMDPAVLNKLVLESRYMNDIRTILVAHDKRMLSVLTDENIMSDYVTPTEFEILRENLVQTFVIEVHRDVTERAKGTRADWLMKPNGGGKGIGKITPRPFP
jgi:hypothetical protein